MIVEIAMPCVCSIRAAEVAGADLASATDNSPSHKQGITGVHMNGKALAGQPRWHLL